MWSITIMASAPLRSHCLQIATHTNVETPGKIIVPRSCGGFCRGKLTSSAPKSGQKSIKLYLMGICTVACRVQTLQSMVRKILCGISDVTFSTRFLHINCVRGCWLAPCGEIYCTKDEICNHFFHVQSLRVEDGAERREMRYICGSLAQTL